MPADVGHPALPRNVSPDQDLFNRWALNRIINLEAELIPPTRVTNFRVTPIAGGNIIDFTRCDGDNYILYLNTTASTDGAVRVELGQANRYTDNVGQASVKKYYAVKAKKGRLEGLPSDWKSGTTLALGAGITAPEPPPSTETPFTDQQTDAVEVGIPGGTGVRIV